MAVNWRRLLEEVVGHADIYEALGPWLTEEEVAALYAITEPKGYSPLRRWLRQEKARGFYAPSDPFSPFGEWLIKTVTPVPYPKHMPVHIDFENPTLPRDNMDGQLFDDNHPLNDPAFLKHPLG